MNEHINKTPPKTFRILNGILTVKRRFFAQSKKKLIQKNVRSSYNPTENRNIIFTYSYLFITVFVS